MVALKKSARPQIRAHNLAQVSHCSSESSKLTCNMTTLTCAPSDRRKSAPVVKTRFIIFVLATLCPVVCYISRQNLSIALVSMVEDERVPSEESISPSASSQSNSSISKLEQDATCPYPTITNQDGLEERTKTITYGPKYAWDSSDTSLILESFFWSYVIFQIPAARLAEVMGTKWVLAFAGIGSALISFASPWACSVNVYLFSLMRLLLGVFQTALFPCFYILFAKWLPPLEREQALPIIHSGTYMGSIVASTATGYFSEQAALGWPYAFYMPGVVCTIWSLIWVMVASSEPQSNKFISVQELEYIASKLEVKSDKDIERSKNPDWIKIFSSRQVLAMNCAFIASNWAFFVRLLLLPSYLNYILHIPPFTNGIINAIIYVLNCVFSPLVGSLSTIMIRTKPFGMTILQVRKLFELIALLSQTLGFLIMPQAGCNTTFVLGILYTQIVLYSFCNGGEVQLPPEITPAFAGTVYAIGNCLGSATGFMVPRMFSWIVHDIQDRQQWDSFFYLAAFVTALGGFIFLFLGGNDREDFAKPVKPCGLALSSTLKNQPDLQPGNGPAQELVSA